MDFIGSVRTFNASVYNLKMCFLCVWTQVSEAFLDMTCTEAQKGTEVSVARGSLKEQLKVFLWPVVLFIHPDSSDVVDISVATSPKLAKCSLLLNSTKQLIKVSKQDVGSMVMQ